MLNAQQLEVIGDGTSSREIVVKNEGNGNDHAYVSIVNASDKATTTSSFETKRSRGTLSVPTDVQANDRLMLLNASQYIDGAYRFNGSIEICAGSTPSLTSYPTFISFHTTDNNETTREERLRITENGNIGIATIIPCSKLQIKDGDVYIEDINKGVIMKSPNGQCWRYSPDNSGTLIGTAIACPCSI